MPKKKSGKKANAKKAVVRIRVVPIAKTPIVKLLAKKIVPCETVGMKKHDRVLQFEAIEQGKPIKGRCSICHRPFSAKPNPGGRTDDALLRIRAEFEAHNCHEDASQAAARIVREATDSE